jgi:hypothetical protein
MKSFFENPGFWFNAISFAFGAAGLALGIWGLLIAIVQLRKLTTAAEAARKAADDTLSEVSRIVTITDVQKLSALCLEIVTLLESDRAGDVNRPLHQLRVGLAEFHASDRGRILGEEFKSLEMVATIESIQEKLDAGSTNPADRRVIRQCISVVKSVDERLHKMIPGAARMP